ncbi:MAG: cytochrome c [Alphaproteobacteria bacterium]|nr:cytochrome c [Alphaproteobacteria bacterium]
MRRASTLPALASSGAIALSLIVSVPGVAQQTNPAPAETAPDEETVDVNQIFASTCGWCHADGGRAAGKGPQLMDTKRSDDFIRDRIKLGKTGAMPAFGQVFDDAQIDAIIRYIRDLKPNP